MLACGKNSSAVLFADGRLHTTGCNKEGQIGHGHSKSKWYLEPPMTTEGVRFKFTAINNSHMAAVDERGDVYVCGSNYSGKLGLGRPDPMYGFDYLARREESKVLNKERVMRRVSSSGCPRKEPFAGERVLMVACGEFFTMALTAGGRVWATGSNIYGQLGVGDLEARYFFTEVDPAPFALGGEEGCHVVSVVTGESHSMMLCENGRLFCCGCNDDGALGNGEVVYVNPLSLDSKNESTPTLVEGLRGAKVSSIAAGVYHSMAITNEGTLFSWGRGWYGQLGHGSSRNLASPKRVWVPETGDDFVLMAAGGREHTVFLTRDSTVWSVGRGCLGVLGTGDIGCRMLPARMDMRWFQEGKDVDQNSRVVMVAAGHHNTGFVTAHGALYMCGRGDGGDAWFFQKDGPGGLSLPRQKLPRLTPVQVRACRGLTLKEPVAVGPGIFWENNLPKLLETFCVPILTPGASQLAGSRRKRQKTSKSGPPATPWLYDMDSGVLAVIAKLVLSSVMPEHAEYHKSVRMLMGSCN